ncbi:malonate-semialdehyde dehydrogenase (acetylating) / methylmalonate-semialdehyde dehydrogenase [Cohaesibacter marisflavi]|uniref:methylmalonate-semialdehyde dehydrogenase (CoA acylating) n=1 Tax=Cohaesibacter marisflavi TaxID=655353 RepID=A0A1I5AKK0_9HYPH|nr:CoA-acylating methylmalonate-semialdehyde dehydrogenase [Cohaesibacter marisflavi]SFN63026.1 malonate-semialdehyde dehydrogenase (acetylating) / methylmalonate-semialdehyde dehydrogenase [Cohaesibacter marisflavi]
MYHVENIINGISISSKSERLSAIYNPATGEQIGALALSTDDEVHAAVAAAKAALAGWAATPPAKRARVMFAYQALVRERADDIAREISREHGKTHDDALGEVARALEVIEFACGVPELLKGEFSRNVGTGIDTHSERQPLGVVAGITPFNFPAMVPMWMFPMAIACGNTFVLKPSERDPSAANFVCELLMEAGLPEGVINVVHGDKSAVDCLLDHPDVKAVSFVGSTPIAEYVYKRGTDSAKRVQALGGAKNHMIVMPDADMDQAADALMGAAFGSAGERCMAVSVAVPIGEETATRLVSSLKPKVEALKIGPASDEAAEMGPVITSAAKERIVGLIDSGVEQGADLVVDGRGFELQGYENGYFVGGTLFDKVTPEMDIYKTEIFGPVLSVLEPQSFETAVDLINIHEYGNGTAIFTRNGDAARKFASQIEVGMVGINVPIPVPVAFHSFGGWKRSSFGSHGIYGPEAIHFYTKLKTTTTRWPEGLTEGAVFTFPS